MFENAKFGDKFVTRDGTLAFYIARHEKVCVYDDSIVTVEHTYALPNLCTVHWCKDNGVNCSNHPDWDIVSRVNKEDATKEAYKRYEPAGMGFDGGKTERKAFIEGAEWMRERMNIVSTHTDNSKVIANMQETIHYLEALVEKQKAVIESNKDQLSSFTEYLDSTEMLGEGVRNLIAERAWDWICENIDQLKKVKSVAEGMELATKFKQAVTAKK